MPEVQLKPGDRVRSVAHPGSVGTVIEVRDNGTVKVQFGATRTNWNATDLEVINV